MERSAQLQQIKQDYDRQQTTHESLDQTLRLEKVKGVNHFSKFYFFYKENNMY